MPEDLVLQILKTIQADMADLKRDVGGLPAMRRDISVLTQDVRMIRAALADLGKTRVSAGEIEVMHADINSLLERMSRVEAAAGLLE